MIWDRQPHPCQENEHMKIAMEELQLKLRNFLSKAEDASGGKVRELVETQEFEAIFSQQTVWESLYEEARHPQCMPWKNVQDNQDENPFFGRQVLAAHHSARWDDFDAWRV